MNNIVPKSSLRVLYCALGLTLSACVLPAPSQAPTATPASDVPCSYPNTTRRLMFAADGDLHVMYSNGSGRQNLTPQTPHHETMPAWSPNGKFIAFVSDKDGNPDIFIAPASAPGDENLQIKLTQDPAQDLAPAWSPNGRQLAFSSNRNNGWGIYTIEVILTEPLTDDPVMFGPVRQTYNSRYEGHPTWAQDGQYLIYTSDQGYIWKLNTFHRMGGDTVTFDGTTWLSAAYPAWSPDGMKLSFAGRERKHWDIYTYDTISAEAQQLTDHPAQDWGPKWSPDGAWIAFTSTRSGNGDIYVTDPTGTALFRLTDSPAVEQYPTWEP